MTTTTITSSRTFIAADRINRSLTAASEARALRWLAEHAPRWVTSDRLTLLGFNAQVLAGVAFAASRLWRPALLLVILCLALNWLGDSLDGTLARVRHQQRPRYGFYVDHVVDIFGAAALIGGLSLSGLLHGWTAAALLVAFLLLAAESYLATYTLARFQLSQGLFGPTEVRILLAIGILAVLHNPYANLLGHRMLLFDLGGAIAAAIMFVMAVVTAARHTAELFRQEPLP
ncbi:MAG TPA: CDP-alcohol phosphatidyltransferase family protein [Acidobacteriaceae bacterium]|nr:CDP-alcohol phosphatidyltransferase family protein [Acidobacteriaceae bacterium]